MRPLPIHPACAFSRVGSSEGREQNARALPSVEQVDEALPESGAALTDRAKVPADP